MNDDYITIKQAAIQSGKSPDTIRRLIKSLLQEQPDTPHIKQEQIANGQQQYFISTAYLAAYYASPQHDAQSPPVHDAQMLMIEILRGQLDEKDRQIANFQMQERGYTNLINQLQERLLLQAPRPTEPEPPIETEPPANSQQPRKRKRFIIF